MVIVGRTVEGEAPPPVAKGHGLIVGKGCSCFATEEAEGKVLVSLAFPVDREMDRVADATFLKDKVNHLSKQFPPLKILLDKAFLSSDSDSDTPVSLIRNSDTLISDKSRDSDKRFSDKSRDSEIFVVNCRDRMPLKGKNPFIFIGDASHAVSPFAGAGANMALVDGWILGKLTSEKDSRTVDELAEKFSKETFGKWEKIVNQQRTTIQFIHSENFFIVGIRAVLLRMLPWMFSPEYKRKRWGLVLFAIGLSLAIIYKNLG